jgi:hypothetical protein
VDLEGLVVSEDKELVEVWRKQFESEYGAHARYPSGHYVSVGDRMAWEGFLIAKRSQPSVVLPKPISINDASVSSKQRITHNDLLVKIAERLTAAGIKYTTGE